MRRALTQYEITIAIDLYNNGKYQWEVAQELNAVAPELNCAQTDISRMLRKHDVPTRVGKKITYTDVNLSFFQEINCEENAYFLGFLYADGNVHIDNHAYSMMLKLQKDDQIILEKLRDIISPSYFIKITEEKYAYISVSQKIICEQLIALGCGPRKSLTLQFPTKVPAHLMNHFIRGYSDGDGCITDNKLKHAVNTIWKITSTKQFCEHVAQLLKDELGINCSQYLTSPETDNQITTTLSVGGNNQTEKILDWLYQDATIYLPRKYERYMAFKTKKLARPYIEFKRLNLSTEQKDQIVRMYNEGMSSNKIADIFKISKPSVLKVLHDSGTKMRLSAAHPKGIKEQS